MNRILIICFWGLVILLVSSCQPDQPVAESPEEVLKVYQKHFDRNEFELAKAYSTKTGQKWLDEISPLMMSDNEQNSILNTTFHKIDCQIEADTATCFCKLEDENELYEATYLLIKVDGIWLVDAPDEDESIEYEDDEEIMMPSEIFE